LTALLGAQATPVNPAQQKRVEGRLEAGKPVEKTLAGGETHSYEIPADAGQFLHAVVEQLGIDVALILYSPDGKQIATMDSPNGLFGLEQISTIADSAGAYRLEIASADKNAPSARYRVTISPVRSPTDTDRARISAERAFNEAAQLASQGNADSLRRAAQKYQESLQLWRTGGDIYEQGWSLNAIGEAYDALGEGQKALDFYDQALPLQRSIGDRDGEAATLNDIGQFYDALGEKQKALDYLNQALPLWRAVGDRRGEAATLSNLGLVYAFLGEHRRALDYYSQALPLERAVGDRRLEDTTLNNMGQAYSYLGEKGKALDLYNQALALQRALGNRYGEAMTLNNIGSIHKTLGEKQKALDYLNQSLPLQRAVGNRSGEARVLTNLGETYNDLGEHQKALDYQNQALPLWRAVGSRIGQAKTLNNIGEAYGDLGEHRRALDYYSQALPLWHAVGDRDEEAITLDNIGFDQLALGKPQEGLANYGKALLLSREVQNPVVELRVLSHLMKYWRGTGEPATAAFFGKQAVNKVQQMRGNIRGLEKEMQESFVKSNEKTYRELADLLIIQGRLPEAQQTLDLLKNEEYFEFIRRDGKEASSLTQSASLTSREEAVSREYEDQAGRVTAIGNEYAALRTKPSRTPDEEKHLAELSNQLKLANEAWEKFLSGLYAELGKSKEAQASVENLQESASGMQRVVRQLGSGTVALYTLVGEQKYRVIVVTPTVMVAREYPITAGELRKKVFEFRQALLNPKSNPVPKAQELYQILLGPTARDLEGAKAVTLMWSLDDVLRYLPMAALHNGHGYLVEKYRNTVFTPASVPGLTALPGGAAWQGLGMGVSRAYGEFRALPAVPDELRGIIRDKNVPGAEGVMPGQMMLDETFTRDTMTKALEGKYPLVHIASHFAFAPGNETDSFLLLGGTDAQGQRLTLAEIRKDPGFTFADTELLTLSACDTAVGGAAGDGREVDGLGILAQQKGARAVVASLWGVYDASTGLLMPEFYKEWTTNTDMPKAEALRNAQLALLRGTTGGPHEALYTHPYYWAPFILIGNWR
jgi:CHAT domain-containing protein/Tfp pilus assembly protein PilF